ncbi:MAG: magnesium transporter [Hyphomicrobiaceae bacterium]
MAGQNKEDDRSASNENSAERVGHVPAPDEPTVEATADAVSDLVSAVAEALARGDAKQVSELTAPLNTADLARVIELLEPTDRTGLATSLGAAFPAEVLSELDETTRDQISEALPNAQIAKAVTDLDTDDAAYVMESLEADDKKDVLAQVPDTERAALERALEYPEGSAGRLMQANFVAVPPYWTIGQVIDHMRETDDLPETFSDIFVVDATFHVLGSVDLSRLLRTKRQIDVQDIMDTERHLLLATEDQEAVARQFERYDLKSAPVVDENRRLVGVVTVDDVVEVVAQEADEDIKRLAGLGDERLTDSVRQIAPPRFSWLLVNLFTAVLASAVIKNFESTIEHMVALAVLMPIVASMGGNAGTQTMTVAVRALATESLMPANVVRVVLRETAVGLINGLLFACIMGAVAVLWFGGSKLGIVMGAAMIINMLAAALAGIFIPLALDRMGFDPAVASTVFVTTVTDVVGFFAFLGLASLLLM